MQWAGSLAELRKSCHHALTWIKYPDLLKFPKLIKTNLISNRVRTYDTIQQLNLFNDLPRALGRNKMKQIFEKECF